MSETRFAESALRDHRLSVGLSMTALAAFAGVSIGTVRRIERGDIAHIRIGSLIMVCACLGLSGADALPILSATGRNAVSPRHGGFFKT